MYGFSSTALPSPPVAFKLLDIHRHLRVGEEVRLAELQRTPVLRRERLDLMREMERRLDAFPEGDLAVMREEACAAAFKRGDGMLAKFRRAEGRIGRAADVPPATATM